MHFEILVEGKSERTALEPILSKILGPYNSPHTWRLHKHQGIGSLPVDLDAPPNSKNPSLLHNLPSRLRAYGKSLIDGEAVIVLLDLDDRPSAKEFEKELMEVLNACNPKPVCKFTFAIEELEAWFLGDKIALKKAYPLADEHVLNKYIQDSQCGTWEALADVIYPGGAKELKKLGVQKLEQKRLWARDIAVHMNVNVNKSQSFKIFRNTLKAMIASSPKPLKKKV